MCRMLAVLSENAVPLQPYFDVLSHMAEYGVRAPHRDGYGVVYKDTDNIVVKELQPAWEHTFNFNGLSTIAAMLHARKSSFGGKTLDNVHPFIEKTDKGTFIFMHNGTVQDAGDVFPGFTAEGEACDSRMYSHLIAREYERTGSLEEAVCAVAAKIKLESTGYTSANAIVLSDDSLYIIRSCHEHPEYYTLYYRFEDGTAVVTTEPGKIGEWLLIGNHTVSKITHSENGYRFDKIASL